MGNRRISSSLLLLTFFSVICFSCAMPQAPAATVDTSASAAPVTSEEYHLAPEDVVGVVIWKEEDFSRETVVRPDGKISLPVIGDIAAAGLTTDELKEKIRQALTEYIDEPTVSVSVLQMNSMKFFVQGEVNSPGAYDLKGNYTVLQAISLAGGFTEWAKKDKIAVFRKEGGNETRITVDYDAITSGKNQGENLILKRGDTIVVP